MSSLFESLTGMLDGDAMKQITQQLGTDEKTAKNATGAAVSTILGAISRNASQEQGAQDLHKALEKDHDGALLDGLQGFLGKGDTTAGDGILRHVMGSRRPQVEAGLGKASGVDGAAMGKLMSMLAPVVMGALGRSQRQSGMGASQLAGLLGSERQKMEQAQPQVGGLLSGLLDADGDGDLDMADIARHGKGMLGKLFGK